MLPQLTVWVAIEFHRRIGGKIAMRRVGRRLDHKVVQIEVGGQVALRSNPAKNRSDQLVELGKEIHFSPT